MKLLLTLMIALFAFISVSAQPTSDSWSTFSPAGEGFSVEVPASMSVSNLAERPDRKDWNATYELNSGGVRYYIFSEGPLSGSSIDTGLKFIHDFKPRGESVSVGDLTGEKFSFIDDEGFNHAALHVKIGDNEVLFHALASTGDNGLEKFIKSVVPSTNQVLPVIPEGSDITSLPGDAPKTSTVLPVKGSDPGNGIASGGGMSSGMGSGSGAGSGSGMGSGSGNGTGFGAGSGSGSGSGRGGGTTAATGKEGTTPFRILSKPRPGYTDAARMYNIQGTVTLRITLLSTGEIGTVSIVSKLPMGLTKSAIKAAKSLRFEPAIVNGVPQTISRTIQYSFTIY